MKKRVGKTQLIKTKLFGYNLYIKDESRNPFGTYKDRRSELIIKKARKNKIKKLVIISSGNACYSLARFTKGSKIQLVCIVDIKIKKKIKNIIKKYSHKILEVDLNKKILSQKEIINLARERRDERILNVSTGFHQTGMDIIKELKNEKPDYVIVPIGSGETFVGLYYGIKKYGLKTILIGVGVKNKIKSFADKLHTIHTPYQNEIKKIVKKGNKLILLNEKEVREAYDKFKKMVKCEPSSAVVLGAFKKIKFKKEDKIIVINSGKGVI